MYQAEVLTDFSLGLSNMFRFLVLLALKIGFYDILYSEKPFFKIGIPSICHIFGAFQCFSVFLIFQFMMETKDLHIHHKKRYIAPNHYFPRMCNYHPRKEDIWDDVSDSDAHQDWIDQPFQRKPNLLDIRIYKLVNECYKKFGYDKPGDFLPEDSFLIFFADMMHHDGCFDDGWDLDQFEEHMSLYINNDEHGCRREGLDKQTAIKLIRRTIRSMYEK